MATEGSFCVMCAHTDSKFKLQAGMLSERHVKRPVWAWVYLAFSLWGSLDQHRAR